MVVTLGQQYHVGEKPTVILYTCHINRRAGTPDKTKTNDTMSLDTLGLARIGWMDGWMDVDAGVGMIMKIFQYTYLRCILTSNTW